MNPSVQAPPFGILIPGQPFRMDWTVVNPNNTQFTMSLSSAKDVSDIVFFLVPNLNGSSNANSNSNLNWNGTTGNAPILADDVGAVLYWQAEGGSGYEILGAVSNHRPSGVFRTNWSQHESILNSKTNVVHLGVSLEPLHTLQNLEIATSGVEDRREFAKKIALNLFNYMQSFDDCSRGNNGMMMVPTNVFERWITRFEAKYKQDPNFFLRNQNG